MINNKRVIYVGGFELPDKNAAAHRVISLGKIILKLGFDLTYIGIHKSDDANILYKKNQVESTSYDQWSIRYPRNSMEWLSFLTSSRNTVNIIEKYNNVDSIILYNYQSLPFIRILHFAKKHNIKVYADVTEWYHQKKTRQLIQIIKNLDSCFRMRYLQKRVNGLIVISKYLANYYRKQHLVIIPPLVDKEDVKWKSYKMQASDNIIFTYSGSPGKKDLINLILNAIGLVEDNYLFRIIGISQTEYLNLYPNDAILLKHIKQRVEFLGTKTHTESINYLKNSDFSFFVRTNDIVSKAGFPTKFVESLACGIPVVTNLTSNISDYLISDVNGVIVPSTNVLEIAETIRKVLSYDKNKIQVMKYNCINDYRFHFDNYVDSMKFLLERE